jgi:cytidylate kinase
MNNKIIVAIDGPAGSGKSSTAKIIAEKIGYIYIDTGAMYRAVTFAAMQSNTPFTDEAMKPLLASINVELKITTDGQSTFVDGQDITRRIRFQEVTKNVSEISALQSVREAMTAMQKRMGENGGIIMDGRDIGTTVFPQAEIKIYLDASVEKRAERRIKELKDKNIPADYEEIEEQIRERDRIDTEREFSPLRKADDAITIDTSEMTLEGQAKEILLAIGAKYPHVIPH